MASKRLQVFALRSTKLIANDAEAVERIFSENKDIVGVIHLQRLRL